MLPLLRKQVKENNVFEWNSTHQQALNAIKNAINAEAALAYHDSTKEDTLQVGASTTGLGAALLQNKKLIAVLIHVATRSLLTVSKTEVFGKLFKSGG